MTNPDPYGPTAGDLDPDEVPRSVLGRFIRSMAVLVVVVIGGGALVVFAGRLPEGTSTGSLVIRGLVGLTIGIIITVVIRKMMRALTDPPPPLPERVDARSTEVVYECPVCGTRVRLEVAATAKAPRHCGEEMESSVREL